MTLADWNGRLLQTALQEQPSLTLEFYSYGVLLRKQVGESVSEYAVDPGQVAATLAAKVTFDTGLLNTQTLLVRQEGLRKLVVEYRAPQKTGLYVDGSEIPLRVPLPGLLLLRLTTDNERPKYGVYAVKKRPVTLDVTLYGAPLPNIGHSGSICWGTVRLVSPQALAGCTLSEDWSALLGSPFGDHSVNGKSRAYPADIRQGLIALEKRQARVYPKRDLIPVNKTLAEVIGEVWR